MTEEDLLRSAAAGDRSAFDAFVAATAPGVWGVVRRLTADVVVAEDVMQETFLAAWGAASGFRGESSARGWLYALARRQAARSWRRRVGEPRQHVPLEELATNAGWGEDPESLVARLEDRAVLLAALERLSAADQELLRRCELGREERSGVAEELGITMGALRVRLHRSRLRLMAVLQNEVDHG